MLVLHRSGAKELYPAFIGIVVLYGSERGKVYDTIRKICPPLRMNGRLSAIITVVAMRSRIMSLTGQDFLNEYKIAGNRNHTSGPWPVTLLPSWAAKTGDPYPWMAGLPGRVKASLQPDLIERLFFSGTYDAGMCGCERSFNAKEERMAVRAAETGMQFRHDDLGNTPRRSVSLVFSVSNISRLRPTGLAARPRIAIPANMHRRGPPGTRRSARRNRDRR